MTVQQSIDRLKDGHWNSDPVNGATNPGGMGADGHRVNFPAALADVGVAAQEAGDKAAVAVQAKDDAETARDVTTAARDVTTDARDVAVAAKDDAVAAAGSLTYASQAQAEAGTADNRLMSPLRHKQAVDDRLASEAEAEAGTADDKLMTPLRTAQAVEHATDERLASEAEAEAGTADDKLMTPLRTAQAVEHATDERLASEAEAEEGTADDKLMSPLRTAQAISAQTTLPAAPDAGGFLRRNDGGTAYETLAPLAARVALGAVAAAYTSRANAFSLIVGHDGGGSLLDLDAPAQTISLPELDDVNNGWTHIIHAIGAPSGFQTAYVDTAVAADKILYRGTETDRLYLLGGGETFRFTAVELPAKTVWLCEIMQQPAPEHLYLRRTRSGGAAWANSTTSWSAGTTNQDTGSSNAQAFSVLASTFGFAAPCSGLWHIEAGMYFDPVAPGGGTAGRAEATLFKNASAELAPGLMRSRRFQVNLGSLIFETIRGLATGDTAEVQFRTSISTLLTWPEYDIFTARLLER
ncbi:hypothetical protein [Pyruvatibacter sp.]|uniref:hypothetical protein n=1 Tax=Pyruvatibacter sp. TaxID=1981328 RepID=UPI0032ED0962